ILRRLRIELAKMGFPLKKKKTNKNIQKNIIYYKSYFWCAFPRNVGSYILNELKKNAYYKDLFFDAMCPEEVFWATLIMNSKYKDRIKTNQTLMYTSEFVNNHPKIIRYEDIDELKKTEYFFARKFDINVDSSVIEYYKKLICEEEI
uniref:hypothetical protein n=1 Tax=Thomasclavelia sp. TaxID=3025757 RepID=UPI0025F95F01